MQQARLVRLLSVMIIATRPAGVLATRADLAEDYTKEIRPLMTQKCYACHNAEKHKGDVMSRRLHRAEYINTFRDLFGVEQDFKLEQLLPADGGGGGEGFDTTGDTLFTSSTLRSTS